MRRHLLLLWLAAARFAAEPNAPHHRDKPYVLLIGLDGFRFDYAQRYGAGNTLATSFAPGEHGIVGNRFYDPQRTEEFDFRSAGRDDGSWYGGTPL